MLTQLNPPSGETETINIANYLSDALIEKLWHEFDEQVTREQIRRTATWVAAQFQNVTVTTFIPVFIYCQTYEKLKRGLGER